MAVFKCKMCGGGLNVTEGMTVCECEYCFGTDYEYYNAVWVKNEWSRFLSLIEKGANKTLIPCYKGIDAYDMPKEFARLQAQDMGKVGAIQDLLRGIEKILGSKSSRPRRRPRKSHRYFYGRKTFLWTTCWWTESETEFRTGGAGSYFQSPCYPDRMWEESEAGLPL